MPQTSKQTPPCSSNPSSRRPCGITYMRQKRFPVPRGHRRSRSRTRGFGRGGGGVDLVWCTRTLSIQWTTRPGAKHPRFFSFFYLFVTLHVSFLILYFEVTIRQWPWQTLAYTVVSNFWAINQCENEKNSHSGLTRVRAAVVCVTECPAHPRNLEKSRSRKKNKKTRIPPQDAEDDNHLIVS